MVGGSRKFLKLVPSDFVCFPHLGAAFLLAVGSFLLTFELLCLQLC